MVGKSEILRNGDVFYPFRQDSDFLLLTWANLQDLRLIGMKKDGTIEWTLYSDEISDHEKLWWTSRLSHRELSILTGIEDIREMKSWKEDLRSYSAWSQKIYIREQDERNIFSGFQKYREKFTTLDLSELRLIKLPEEIEKIRKAISITHEAHRVIRDFIRPWVYEYEIEAEIARVFRAHHATEAYPTIVASGVNACTLHYTRHNKKIEAGELVLVDFGAEFGGYAADITRVFSASSSWFSPRQKEVFDSVFVVKSFALSQIKPGVKKSDYEKTVREKMNEELVKLGLMKSNEKSRELLSRRCYPHSTSHFLGLDVHDVGSREVVFREGMVITCEPGIYIPEEQIGIRLEDDILVTEGGCENLSSEIPLLNFS